MTFLFGLMLLISLASIGRDSRVLPFHGLCASACTALEGNLLLSWSASLLLLVLNLAAWALLKPYAVHRVEDALKRRLSQQTSAVAASAALFLIFLFALDSAPPIPLLFSVGAVLAGVCGGTLRYPLQQCVGLFCTLNSLLLLGTVAQSAALVFGSATLFFLLLLIAKRLMARLAWLHIKSAPYE